MEDTFSVRVDRTFGSLEPSSSIIPPQQSSLWSLTDEEIQHSKWIQPKPKPEPDTERIKNPKPFSPFLQSLTSTGADQKSLKADIQELDIDSDADDDDDDGEQKTELLKPNDHNNEEWDIRTCVGLDCTLDNEEEEDGYDKVAVGKELSEEERFYMKDVNDYEVEMESNIQLPSSLIDVTRDPRANHKAAKLRLKEDDESAEKLPLSSLYGSTSSKVPDHVRNPSRYTHYTFDSNDEVDEESNRKAYMELFNTMRGSAAMDIQHDVSTDSLKSIVFTPKKSSDGLKNKSMVDGNEENVKKKAIPISIVEDSDVCMMDEDEPVINKSSSLQKSGRKYRTKGSADVE